MNPKTLRPPIIDRNAARAELRELLARVTVADFLELVAELGGRPANAGSEPKYFDRENPPPGMSWRSARDHGRRGCYPLLRVGRTTVIERAAWAAWAERQRAVPKLRRRPAGGESISERDGDQFSKLGLVLPIRGQRG